MFKKCLFALSLLAGLVLSGCATTGAKEPQITNIANQAPVQTYTLLDFYNYVPPVESEKMTCVGVLSTTPGQNVTAMVSGSTPVVNPAPVPASLGKTTVTSLRRKYYYDGQIREITFEIVYFNIEPKYYAERSVIMNSDVIGTACGDSAGVVLRSENLEPYLLSVSNTKPNYIDGHWYYYPGIMDSSEVKWLDFYPPEDSAEELKELYDHATEVYQETLGHTFGFLFQNLYETTLPVYPFLQEDGSSVLGIDYMGCPMLLYFQPGFYEYLQNEYTLGDKIYLLLQIADFTAGPEEGTLAYEGYVRDYCLVSPTEGVFNKFTLIKESYSK
ncbi:MAG: hypothetical protein MJ176_04720 [Treponema sp.]|nr:hypothetical protein [Treponema sp.]